MEAVAFAVGLSGLISVFDKTCVVWRTIGAAKNFGDDVECSIRKLEIEFFRFQSWWRAVQKLEISPARPGGQPTYPEMPLLTVYLSSSAENPIVSAAQGVLGVLLDIESLFRESGVLEVMESQSILSGSPRDGMLVKRKRIEDQVSEAILTKNKMRRQLMEAIPWRKRVKHDAAPWRQSDKQRLESKLQEMVYLNDVLYKMLPPELKDSILRQGISGYVLADPGEATALSQLGDTALSQQARFFEAHRKLMTNNSMVSPALEARQRLIDISQFDPVRNYDDEPFSIVRSSNGQVCLIEWYQLPETTRAILELRSIARERLAKLSVLLSAENKPSTLCAAESIGYVDANHFYRLGLVSRVPDGACITTLPVSLYSLLCRKSLPGTSSQAPLPTLSQRFTLASALASSLYTFMLARWYHKTFNSLNIYFMFSEAGNNLPNLNSPLVGGYSVSRPSTEEEISICGTQTSLSETYLHPQLRVSAQRPKYASKYEVYAFGLLLAEIGFWRPISKIAAAHSLSADGLKDAVIAKSSSDLACWMGEQYRDVTLRCLRVDDALGTQIGDGLSDFYWSVVLELTRCAERAKVFNCL